MRNWVLLIIAMLLINSTRSHATTITTGDLNNTTTLASPMISNIMVSPSSTIRFQIGGAAFSTTSSQLSVTINVDALVPTVTSGTAANQMFRDENIGAAYFGYYLSTGVKSASQPHSSISVKIRRGSAESAGRSYYLLGNGITTPTSQGDLTLAPASYTTVATAGSNGSHCGPRYVLNGLTSAALNCSAGTTVPNMDITQFVKVLDSDTTSSSVISQIEFIAINE